MTTFDTNPTDLPTTSVFLNTSVPNMARIIDYLSGGTAHFEADRMAAGAMLQVIPSLGKWVRLRRAFIQEAAHQLHEAGFRQFIDFGSGMPADDHIHAFAPQAHIVYSDLNPVAVSYGQSIFADQDTIAYIRGDIRRLQDIVLAPETRRLINLEQPVAIGLNGLMGFLSEDDNQKMAHALCEWAPDGSRVFTVLQTRGDNTRSETYEHFRHLCRSAGFPIELYTYAQHIEMMKPWKPVTIAPVAEFLGLPDDFITPQDQTDIGVAFYAAFLEK